MKTKVIYGTIAIISLLTLLIVSNYIQIGLFLVFIVSVLYLNRYILNDKIDQEIDHIEKVAYDKFNEQLEKNKGHELAVYLINKKHKEEINELEDRNKRMMRLLKLKQREIEWKKS